MAGERYGPFFTKADRGTRERGAAVLDALLYHQSEVPTCRRHTDAAVIPTTSLPPLLGFQFAPRIPDFKHRRLYSFGKPSDYPTLEPSTGARWRCACSSTWPMPCRPVTCSSLAPKTFADYRAQLLPWAECEARLPGYRAALGIPERGEDFAAVLKAELATLSAAVDAGFPTNTEFSLDADGTLHLKQLASA